MWYAKKFQKFVEGNRDALLISPTQQDAEGRITFMNVSLFIVVWGVSKDLRTEKKVTAAPLGGHCDASLYMF